MAVPAAWAPSAGPGSGTAYIEARHLRFGGEAFENGVFAGGELTRQLGREWWLDLAYEFGLTRGGNDFDFVDGTTHAVEAVVDQSGLTGWRLSAEVETTDAEDRDTGDDFFSFSRDRITLAADYALALSRRDRVVLTGDWRHSRYDGDEVRNGVSRGEREDDRYGVELAFKRRFDARWRATLSARLEQRNSNLDEFDYDREVLRAGISRRF